MILTRRGFLIFAGSSAAAAGAKVESIHTISQDRDFYHGWPTITRRKNGELLVVCSGGRDTHVCPFGRVDLIRSKDDGQTWTWPEILMDTAIDDRDAGILETPKGSLLVTTFTSLAYEPTLQKATDWPQDRLERWRAADRRLTPAQRKSMLGTWMLRSADGGMTWSAPYRVPVNSPHGPVALADGRLLYAGKMLWEQPPKVGVAESSDDGLTWRWLSDIPTRSGDTFENYHELHAVQAADGRIVVHIRNHNQANHRETLQCESSDGGRTWSSPHPIGVWGLPSHLLRLKDGRLLMSYGHRRKPFGNQARLSSDHGRTWSAAILISGDGMAGDLGYPSTVELSNGTLLSVWYELRSGSPNAVLRQARWRLDG
ncbi:MAG TPA: sialidase family protein [Bryobacteraceae bacterium]|nr:sialidase family protein [Bryobacteraceae bacterium]